MISSIITILFIIPTVFSSYYPQERTSEEWGNLEMVNIDGYYENSAQAMEPFISRDGKWFFFNSINVGNDTSLHYGLYINSTNVKYIAKLTGQANGPIPHLDAVPAMDIFNNFYWVSTRNYPSNWENLQHGVFEPIGTIPTATPVHGDIYIRHPVWIVMDQEINIDGSLLFYVNAQFSFPPGDIPLFSNISFAIHNDDGSFTEHPNAVQIMMNVNQYRDPSLLRYGPSTLGSNALELYFTLRSDNTSNLYVSKRSSPDEPFGVPILIPLPPGRYLEPEAPTLTADGNIMMFSRLDCEDKYGCHNINVYKLDRLTKTDPSVLL